MHALITALLISFILCFFPACQSGPDIHVQAEEMCACLKPLDSLNMALTATMAAGDTEEITDALVVLSASAAEAKRCLGTHKLPGNSNVALDPKLKKVLSELCTGWEELLNALPPE